MVEGRGNLREVKIEAVVIRADGSREDLGEVGYWHKSPVRRVLRKVKEAIRGDIRT